MSSSKGDKYLVWDIASSGFAWKKNRFNIALEAVRIHGSGKNTFRRATSIDQWLNIYTKCRFLHDVDRLRTRGDGARSQVGANEVGERAVVHQ